MDTLDTRGRIIVLSLQHHLRRSVLCVGNHRAEHSTQTSKVFASTSACGNTARSIAHSFTKLMHLNPYPKPLDLRSVTTLVNGSAQVSEADKNRPQHNGKGYEKSNSIRRCPASSSTGNPNGVQSPAKRRQDNARNRGAA